MELKEALIALAEGCKIKLMGWESGVYIHLKNGRIVDEENHTAESWLNTKGHWQYYVEKIKPIDELNAFWNNHQDIMSEQIPRGIWTMLNLIVEYLNDKEKETKEKD